MHFESHGNRGDPRLERSLFERRRRANGPVLPREQSSPSFTTEFRKTDFSYLFLLFFPPRAFSLCTEHRLASSGKNNNNIYTFRIFE